MSEPGDTVEPVSDATVIVDSRLTSEVPDPVVPDGASPSGDPVDGMPRRAVESAAEYGDG